MFHREKDSSPDFREDVEPTQERNPLQDLTKSERRWVALGALKSALLIALVFIAGLGLAILLMIFFWS